VQHVVGDDLGASAVVAFAGGGVEAFEGGFADVLAFGFGVPVTMDPSAPLERPVS
jgi:hypothetical protein